MKKNAFTLVELLVSISIIAVLSAILLPNFMGARERARDAQKIQDLESVKNALRMYYNDNQSYPNTSCGDGTCLSSGTYDLSKYMPGISGLGFGYSYETTGTLDTFKLRVGLESGTGDEPVNSQIKCGISPTVPKVFAVCAN